MCVCVYVCVCVERVSCFVILCSKVGMVTWELCVASSELIVELGVCVCCVCMCVCVCIQIFDGYECCVRKICFTIGVFARIT